MKNYSPMTENIAKIGFDYNLDKRDAGIKENILEAVEGYLMYAREHGSDDEMMIRLDAFLNTKKLVDKYIEYDKDIKSHDAKKKNAIVSGEYDGGGIHVYCSRTPKERMDIARENAKKLKQENADRKLLSAVLNAKPQKSIEERVDLLEEQLCKIEDNTLKILNILKGLEEMEV